MSSKKPLDFLWFIPTPGDGSYLGSNEQNRPADHRYFREIATAADRLGYSGVLIPTSIACEEPFLVAAALAPHRDEMELARELRALSPSATPNARLIALADALLRREGRMVEAVRSIGRGCDAFEGEPFALRV